MYKRLIGTALVFGMAATAPPPPAMAQTFCGPRHSIIRTLKMTHGEAPIGLGLSSPTSAYELWRSDKTKSWTILLTRPNNLSCIIATGTDWIDNLQSPARLGKPARHSPGFTHHHFMHRQAR